MRHVQTVLVILVPLLPALCASPSLQLATSALSSPDLHKSSDIWKDCSKRGDPLHIERVSIYPDPPKKGEAVSLRADLRLEEVVTNGSVAVELKYGIVPLLQRTWPLCDFARSQHRHCPLEKGPLRIDFNTTVPRFWPDGHFTGNAVAMDQNSTQLLCVDIDLQL